MPTKSFLFSFAFALLIAVPAHAHTGVHDAYSFVTGLSHPLGGLDHLLAMFAVGLLAAQIGGRAIWLVPGAFVAMMLLSSLAGFSGMDVPVIELGIAMSIVAIALPVAFAFGMPASLAMVYVGFFALFHGYAHGTELPAGGNAAPYMFGFAASTALIHASGIAFGLALGRYAAFQRAHGLRLAGATVVLAGISLIAV